jgi:molybdopterin-guanine dinucleotide biosynthesis protein A
MLEMVETALRLVADRIVLLGPDRVGWDSWPDSIHAHGPLAGIATALNRTDTDHVLVVAVDHPFVRHETLRKMLDRAGDIPVVPVDDHGTRQVTCAVYPKTIARLAAEEAESGGSIQSLLDQVSFDAVPPDAWVSWGEDGRSWFSVDSQDALRQALGRYQEQ